MSQIQSLLREAATRRRLIGAGNDAGGVPAADSTATIDGLTTRAKRATHAATCWAEVLSTQVTLTLSQFSQQMSQAQQPSPPIPQHAPAPRTSADFTAQVMARLAATPPEPDPREARTKQGHQHIRRLAGVYLTLVLLGVVVLLALATLAPWTLVGLVAGIVSIALVAMTFAAFISRLTGGLVSGIGVAYLAMLATLSSSLLFVARRAGRFGRARDAARGSFTPSRRL